MTNAEPSPGILYIPVLKVFCILLFLPQLVAEGQFPCNPV